MFLSDRHWQRAFRESGANFCFDIFLSPQTRLNVQISLAPFVIFDNACQYIEEHTPILPEFNGMPRVICCVAGTLPNRQFPRSILEGRAGNGQNIGVTAKNDVNENDIRKIRIHIIILVPVALISSGPSEGRKFTIALQNHNLCICQISVRSWERSTTATVASLSQDLMIF